MTTMTIRIEGGALKVGCLRRRVSAPFSVFPYFPFILNHGASADSSLFISAVVIDVKGSDESASSPDRRAMSLYHAGDLTSTLAGIDVSYASSLVDRRSIPSIGSPPSPTAFLASTTN